MDIPIRSEGHRAMVLSLGQQPPLSGIRMRMTRCLESSSSLKPPTSSILTTRMVRKHVERLGCSRRTLVSSLRYTSLGRPHRYQVCLHFPRARSHSWLTWCLPSDWNCPGCNSAQSLAINSSLISVMVTTLVMLFSGWAIIRRGLMR